MGKNVLIISGSSSTGGDTSEIVDMMMKGTQAEHIRLIDQNYSYYDYEHKNKDDDFFVISKKMMAADDIVFATPVYWYSMSGPMKTFFDRMTDLVTIRKEDGRALEGTRTWLLVNGGGTTMPEGFDVPFRLTSEYFSMSYQSHYYVHTYKDEALKAKTYEGLEQFKQEIFKL